MNHLIARFAVLAVALCTGSVLGQAEPAGIQVNQCKLKEYKFAQPQLITDPQSRISCAYFANLTQYLPFEITVTGNSMRGMVPGLGGFTGETEPCPTGTDQCMVLKTHPMPGMDGAVQFYDNGKFRANPSLDPAKLPYVAVQDCKNGTGTAGEPGFNYIEFRDEKFGTLDDEDYKNIEELYGITVDKTALEECLKKKDSAFTTTPAP